MSDCRSVQLLEQMISLNQKYENLAEVQADTALLNEVRRFRIRVPVIGKFSAGKSTLINTFLDYRTPLLAEDILPETAVPAEISYGETDTVYLYPVNAAEPPQTISLRTFLRTGASPETVSKVRLELNHTKLAHIPQIDLIDMPGFGSGYQDHNRVLDQYLPGSSAYLLVFSIDEAVLTETMVAILKELILRRKDIPLCVVLTRAGRRTKEAQEEIVDQLTAALKKHYPLPFKVYRTEREDPGSSDVLLDFLEKLQEQYAQLQDNYYHTAVAVRAEHVCTYLHERLRNATLSESECAEEIQRLQEGMEQLRNAVTQQKTRFRSSLPQCKDLILADIEEMLRRKKSSYVQRLINGRPIERKLNEDVRSAVIQGIQTHFEPDLQNYLSQIDVQIQSSVHVLTSASTEDNSAGDALKAGMGAGVAAGGTAAMLTSTGVISSLPAASALTSGLAASLGSGAASAAIPIVGVAIGALVAALTLIMHRARRQERMEELGRELESEVFPQILEKLSLSIETSLEDTLQKADAAIDAEIQKQQQLLQKALEDAQAKHSQEEAAAEQANTQIRADLEEMEALYHAYIGA